ncbi:insulinase family protein [Vibrio harveyi]|uniref:M16 family metallopeptidase n=1 Tax=Vibrio harveyi TaxID=669 RepID=UPI0038CD3ED6
MRSTLLLPALLLSGCALTPQSTPLQADANWHVDQLANGMKYHIYPTQDEEVSVRLMMNVGSFQEDASQKGYAHFIEHMAFNGSTHFSGNDVVKLFEASGGSFGADINATTTYQQTTYKLDLANPDKLNEALTWMRDIGDGIQFDPTQVEKEKGVILGEWRRSRPDDKPLSFTAYEATIEGTPYAEHDPIGTRSSIENTSSPALKRFYDKWYQPQYAELIITGNVDVDSIAKIIEKKFSNWESTSDVVVEKRRDIRANNANRILPSSQMESPSLHLIIDRDSVMRQTLAQQHSAWQDEVSAQLIQQRLLAVLNDAAESFQYAYAQPYTSNYHSVMSAGVSFAPERRDNIQKIFLNTLTSLRDYGVTQQELDGVMSGWYGELSNLDSDWSKRKPAGYAEARTYQLEINSVSQSKQGYEQSLSSFIDSNTLDHANDELKALLSEPANFVIGLGKNEDKAQFSGQFAALSAAYAQAGEKPLDMYAQTDGFIQPTKEGTITKMREEKGGFQVYTLSNGIEVWFQKDEKAANRAYVYLASQGGKAALDKSLYPAFDVATMAAARSGLGGFSGSELDSYLRKTDISLFPILGATNHGVEVIAPKAHLASALNGLYNIMTEIKVDERQLAAVKREFVQQRRAFFESPMGKWVKAANENAYLPNSRQVLLAADGVKDVTPEQVFALHETLFNHNRGYKMVMVADIDPEQITPLLRKYVASIDLKPSEAVDYHIDFNPNAQKRLVMAEGHEPSSLYLLRLTNGNEQPRTAQETVVIDILQRIAAARVTDQLREEASLDYSPSIYPITQDEEMVSDWFFESQIDPKDVSKMDAQLGKIIDDLATNITQKEVDIAKKQLVVAMKDIDDSPGQRSWAYTRYLVHDYGLDVLLDIDKAAQSVTLEEVKALAKRAFGNKAKRTTIILNPKS